MAHSKVGGVGKAGSSGLQGGMPVIMDLLQLVADMGQTGKPTSGLQSLLDGLKANQTSAANQVQAPGDSDEPDDSTGDSGSNSMQGIMQMLIQLMQMMLQLLGGGDQDSGSGEDGGVGPASKPASSVAKGLGGGGGGDGDSGVGGSGRGGKGGGGASGVSGGGDDDGGSVGDGGDDDGSVGDGGDDDGSIGDGGDDDGSVGDGGDDDGSVGDGGDDDGGSDDGGSTVSKSTSGATTGGTAAAGDPGSFSSKDPSIQQWAPDISKAATATGLDPNLIGGQMWAESRGNPDDPSTNSDGTTDLGTMQIGQERWLNDLVPNLSAQDRANIKTATGKEPEDLDMNDPHDNVIGGAFELKSYVDENNGDVNAALMEYVGVGDEQGYADHVLANQAALAAGQNMNDDV